MSDLICLARSASTIEVLHSVVVKLNIVILVVGGFGNSAAA